MREKCKDRRVFPNNDSGQSTSAFVGSRSWVPPEIHPPLSFHPYHLVSTRWRSRHGRSIRPILALPLSSPYLSNCELSPPPRRGANVTRTFKRINGIQRRNRSYIFETIFVSSFFKKKISLTPRVPFASGDLIDRGCSCAFHEDRRCENRREPIFNRLPTSLSIPFRKEGS